MLSVLGSISCKLPHGISGYSPRTESQDLSSQQERWDVGFHSEMTGAPQIILFLWKHTDKTLTQKS